MQATAWVLLAFACFSFAIECRSTPSPAVGPLNPDAGTETMASDEGAFAAAEVEDAGPEFELGASSGRWLDEGPMKEPGKLSPKQAKQLKEDLKTKTRQGRISELEWRTLQKLCEESGDKTCP